MSDITLVLFEGAALGLMQFLGTKNLLKTMKNAFYLTLKTLFVLEIFKFLFWLFGHIGKRLEKKA